MQMIALAPTPFDQWAASERYDITPAVSPSKSRAYADGRTQEAYENFQAGARSVASMLMHSTFESEAFREKMRELAGMP
jgi:hypothetical protein